MNKVTIEITDKGCKTTINLGEKVVVDEFELTDFGLKGLNESLEYNENIPEELYYALDGLNCYEVARALDEIS